MILLNIIIGFIQDLQAARTIASLESLNSPTARVIRSSSSSSSSVTVIPAAEIVPGDIIDLKTGDVVPADARLLDVVNLEADEALLTGESVPVRKDPDAVFDDPAMNPGDRINVAFSSSTVTKGRGRAVVVATGLRTEVGAIAAALQADGGAKRKLKRDENGKASLQARVLFALGRAWDWLGKFLGVTVGTPLQRKLAQLFLYIFVFAIICCIIVLGANEFSTRTDVIIYAVATAIGTLPVTLILVLTITMAAGAKVMVERNVLVRNMRSLEALGGVTSECFSFFPFSRQHPLTCPRHLLRQDWHLDPRQDGRQNGMAPWPRHLLRRHRQRALQPRSRNHLLHARSAQGHLLQDGIVANSRRPFDRGDHLPLSQGVPRRGGSRQPSDSAKDHG